MGASFPSQQIEPTKAADAVEYVIDIVKLCKRFARRGRAPQGYTTFKAALLSFFKSKKELAVVREEPKAFGIEDLTLRIPKGASVGLIGRNGSGKSTFLKLVTGIYKPTSGEVNVKGRIAALIELGAGFHPDFTGRENLMLAGIMHGLTREQILARYDEIVEFAELEHVIDEPVRTYSSGMFMRLGFSIAIHTDPDILLVDEVLAVGDAGFVAKCKDRISELRKAGKTLVLVTHDLDAVERWCDEVIWLHQGEVKDRGFPRRVIDAYRSFIEKQEQDEILNHEQGVVAHVQSVESDAGAPKGSRWGSREIEIVSVETLGSDASEKRVYHSDDTMRVKISYRVHAAQDEVVFGLGVSRVDGLPVFGTNTDIDRIKIPALRGEGIVECDLKRLGLVEGGYTLDVAVHRADGYPFDYHKDAIHFSVRSERREVGVVSPPRAWIVNGERSVC